MGSRKGYKLSHGGWAPCEYFVVKKKRKKKKTLIVSYLEGSCEPSSCTYNMLLVIILLFNFLNFSVNEIWSRVRFLFLLVKVALFLQFYQVFSCHLNISPHWNPFAVTLNLGSIWLKFCFHFYFLVEELFAKMLPLKTFLIWTASFDFSKFCQMSFNCLWQLESM